MRPERGELVPGNGKTTQARLAELPREPGLVLEGGIRQLSTQTREGERVIHPTAILWVDATLSTVRTHDLVTAPIDSEETIAAAVDALVTALTKPSVTSGGQPALAGIVRVDSPPLAAALQPLLDPLDVDLQLVDHLPVLEDAFDSLDAYLEEENRPGPFTWELDRSVLVPLYQAAATFARHAPWTYLADYPPFAVAMGKAGPQGNAKTLYGCVLGAQETVFGIAFYFSRAGLERAVNSEESLFPEDMAPEDMRDTILEMLRSQGAPIDAIPPDILEAAIEELTASAGQLLEQGPTMENTLVMYFDPAEELDETYLAWIEDRGLPLVSPEYVPSFVRTFLNGDPRMPNKREAAAITLALEGVNGFIQQNRQTLEQLASSPLLPEEGLLTTFVPVSGDQKIEVRWPGD